MANISNDGYQHRRHNKNLLMIHMIFVVKYRKQLLLGSIREDVMQKKTLVYKKNGNRQRSHSYIVAIQSNR